MSYFDKIRCTILVDEILPIAEFIYQNSLKYISAREGTYNILTHSYVATDWPIIDFNCSWSIVLDRFDRWKSSDRVVVVDNERHGISLVLKPKSSIFPWHFLLPCSWLDGGYLKPFMFIAASEIDRINNKMLSLVGN